VSDPLASFAVKVFVPMRLFGLDVSLTNSAVFMVVVTCLVSVFLFFGTANKGLIPSKIQAITESLFYFVGDLVRSNIGPKGGQSFPYILALFLFVLGGNIVGLLPFSFACTAQLTVTLAMACLVVISSVILGITNKGKSYFHHFCPSVLPLVIKPFFALIETMSFLFRPLSLGVRLFANMVSGHIMIEIMAGFAASAVLGGVALSFASILPITMAVLLTLFKIGVCMLQAYVFSVLSCIYLSESVQEKNDC
jgi:F-type H+-transporting ATPase subunit a